MCRLPCGLDIRVHNRHTTCALNYVSIFKRKINRVAAGACCYWTTIPPPPCRRTSTEIVCFCYPSPSDPSDVTTGPTKSTHRSQKELTSAWRQKPQHIVTGCSGRAWSRWSSCQASRSPPPPPPPRGGRGGGGGGGRGAGVSGGL